MHIERRYQVPSISAEVVLVQIGDNRGDLDGLLLRVLTRLLDGNVRNINARDIPALRGKVDGISALADPKIQRRAGLEALDHGSEELARLRIPQTWDSAAEFLVPPFSLIGWRAARVRL